MRFHQHKHFTLILFITLQISLPCSLASESFIRWHYPFNKWFGQDKDTSEVANEVEEDETSLIDKEANSEPYVRWRAPLDKFFNPKASEHPDYAITKELPLPAEQRFRMQSKQENHLLLAEDSNYSEFIKRYVRPSHLFFTPDSVVTNPEQTTLSLEDAIRFTLESNTNILIQDIQTDIEDSRIAIEKGAFDPTLEISSTYQKFRAPQNTQEFISSGGSLGFGGLSGEPNIFAEENLRNSIRLSGREYTGLNYELSYSLNIVENSINTTNTSSLFSPEYTSSLSLRLTQPLARDAGYEANLALVKIARRNREIADAQLRSTLVQTLAEMLSNYLDFVYAFEEFKLRSSEVDNFGLLVEETEKRLEKGMVSQRQLLSVKASRAESQDRQLIAQQNVANTRSRLLDFFPSKTENARLNYIPTGYFSKQVPEVERSELIRSTLATSPELLRYQVEYERDKLELKVAENQAKPQFNLVTAFGNTGLERDPHSSLYSGIERSTYSVEVGVVYSRPWDNSAAEARLREVKKQKRQTELEIRRIEQQAVALTLRYAEELPLQQQRYDIATTMREVMQKNVEEEEMLLEKGEKSIYETLEFYNDLYETKIRELSVLRDLNKTKANLWFADGSLLERFGIVYETN